MTTPKRPIHQPCPSKFQDQHMVNHDPESPQDRSRRQQRQARARQEELHSQAVELKQRGQSQLRDCKARQAAEDDTGLEDNDPRATGPGQ